MNHTQRQLEAAIESQRMAKEAVDRHKVKQDHFESNMRLMSTQMQTLINEVNKPLYELIATIKAM